MEKNVLESVSYSLKKLKILIFAMQFILYKKCIPLRLRSSVEPQASVGLEMSPKGPKVLKNQEVKNVQDHYPDIINNQGMFLRENSFWEIVVYFHEIFVFFQIV